jgi:hypothetical protein
MDARGSALPRVVYLVRECPLWTRMDTMKLVTVVAMVSSSAAVMTTRVRARRRCKTTNVRCVRVLAECGVCPVTQALLGSRNTDNRCKRIASAPRNTDNRCKRAVSAGRRACNRCKQVARAGRRACNRCKQVARSGRRACNRCKRVSPRGEGLATDVSGSRARGEGLATAVSGLRYGKPTT